MCQVQKYNFSSVHSASFRWPCVPVFWERPTNFFSSPPCTLCIPLSHSPLLTVFLPQKAPNVVIFPHRGVALSPWLFGLLFSKPFCSSTSPFLRWGDQSRSWHCKCGRATDLHKGIMIIGSFIFNPFRYDPWHRSFFFHSFHTLGRRFQRVECWFVFTCIFLTSLLAYWGLQQIIIFCQYYKHPSANKIALGTKLWWKRAPKASAATQSRIKHV